jgi:hypothetical protein
VESEWSRAEVEVLGPIPLEFGPEKIKPGYELHE